MPWHPEAVRTEPPGSLPGGREEGLLYAGEGHLQRVLPGTRGSHTWCSPPWPGPQEGRCTLRAAHALQPCALPLPGPGGGVCTENPRPPQRPYVGPPHPHPPCEVGGLSHHRAALCWGEVSRDGGPGPLCCPHRLSPSRPALCALSLVKVWAWDPSYPPQAVTFASACKVPVREPVWGAGRHTHTHARMHACVHRP